MAGISFSSLRVGQKYWLKNFEEEYRFEILEILHPIDFILKDLLTLEKFRMSEVIQFGKGEDFEIREISS
jgi:hypothetical protein